MRQWALLKVRLTASYLVMAYYNHAGLMTVPTAYTGDNTRAWGTVQKFKTGVNGAFAATPNGGDIFIESAMSLRSAYRTGAVWQ